MSEKVWFITGASRGFGREWAIGALRRGDKVAVAVRNLDSVADLVSEFGDAVLPLKLDVTDRQGVVDSVELAHNRFGRIDVIINNAGYGLLGAVEELSEQQIRAQYETNVFGAIWLTQAVLPILREQGFGHILFVSSIGGVITLPYGSVYASSKWAIEGLADSLAKDLAFFDVNVTIIEPGAFDTGFQTSAARGEPHSAYEPVRDALQTVLGGSPFGRPEATTDLILKVVDALDPPLRILLGSDFPAIEADYRARLDEWKTWEHDSIAAKG